MSEHPIEARYHKRQRKHLILILASVISLILLSIAAVGVGSAEISMGDVGQAIFRYMSGDTALSDDVRRLDKIILLLRMPRVLLGVLAGMGLSISGTVMQSLTRNPLVSPFTIGLSSAAAFGACLAIILGIGIMPHTSMGIVLNAFISALLCAVLVYSIAGKIGMSPEALILTGVALSYLFGALTATLQFIADENQLSTAIQWTFGSLNGATWAQVMVVSIILSICLPILLGHAWILNAMASSGDEFIKGIGINPKKKRALLGLLAVLMTASIISFTGVIGFIGLVSPHIARLVIGSEHRFLIPISGLLGGILLLLSDTIGRILLSPVTIPVGIVISYIGVPLFVNLILARRKEYF